MEFLRSTRTSYEQPVTTNIYREVDGSVEAVHYLPKSHVRIWHNTQPDGYATHHHSDLEVIFCQEMPYGVTVFDQHYTLLPGDILIIPPHLPHSCDATPSGARFVGLFNIDVLSEFNDFSLLNPSMLTPYFLNPEHSPSLYAPVKELFLEIIDLYFSHDVMWELSLFSKVFELFSYIGKYHYGSLIDPEKTPSGNYDKLAGLLSYLDSHYSEDLSLEEVASLVGFSKFHFSRIFKEFTGRTYYDYLSLQRIQAAQRLLNTDASITDIAFRTGFNSLPAFCRAFKKYTNLSPTEYRDLHDQSLA